MCFVGQLQADYENKLSLLRERETKVKEFEKGWMEREVSWEREREVGWFFLRNVPRCCLFAISRPMTYTCIVYVLMCTICDM